MFSDTDTEDPRRAPRAGIDVRVSALTCSVSDGAKAVPVRADDDEVSIGTTLRMSPDGPRASTKRAVGEDDRTADVFPRLPAKPEGMSERDRAGFELGATALFEQVVPQWRDGVGGAVDQLDGSGAHQDSEAALNRPLVQVPGGYEETDREDVTRALRAAGVEPLDVVRAPLATAAAHVPALSEPTLLAVVDIGEYWCNVGIVDVDPAVPSYRVLARSAVPGLGREASDEAVAEWVFEREAEDRNVEIEYDPGAFARVREAARAALDEFATRDETSIVVPELDGVSLEIGTGPIDVDQVIDIADSYDILDDQTGRLVEELRRVLRDGDVDRSDLDDVLISGTGTVPPSVRRAVEGFLEVEPRTPELGERATAPAHGAAVLATQYDGEASPIERETVDREIGLVVPTEEGPDFETVVPATVPRGETREIELVTTADDQTHGYLQVAARHPVTGHRESLNCYDVTGIPPRAAGQMQVVAEITPRNDAAGGIDTSVSVAPDIVEGAIDQSLGITAVPEEAADEPWLGRVDDHPEEIVARREASSDARTALIDPVEAAFEDTSPERVVDRLIDVRYNLWTSMQAADGDLVSTLEGLLTQFDSGLRKVGVKPIEPDSGDEKDLAEHSVWGTEPAEQPDDTVIRVRRPGYKIDDRVIDPADVIISQGEPGPDDEAKATSVDASGDSDGATVDEADGAVGDDELKGADNETSDEQPTPVKRSASRAGASEKQTDVENTGDTASDAGTTGDDTGASTAGEDEGRMADENADDGVVDNEDAADGNATEADDVAEVRSAVPESESMAEDEPDGETGVDPWEEKTDSETGSK